MFLLTAAIVLSLFYWLKYHLKKIFLSVIKFFCPHELTTKNSVQLSQYAPYKNITVFDYTVTRNS